MTRTGNAAVAYGLSHDHWATGMCQQFVRSCFDVGPHYGSAIAAWNGADHKHRVAHGAQVPRAVPVFWSGGSKGFGHVALSIGGGLCRSTDWPSSGRVGTVAIDTITANWHEHFLGWTEDINTVRIWSPGIAPAPVDNTVALHNLVPGARNHDVEQLQQRLTSKGIHVPATGYFGPITRDAVHKWQYKLGYRGADANGIPGRVSTQRLGLRVTA
jgi:hypothetical protein